MAGAINFAPGFGVKGGNKMNNRIMLKNISSATVVVVSDKFRRELVPGREVPITRAIYDDLMFDPGFINLLDGHFVTITGIAEENAVNSPVNQKTYDVAAISKMFDTKDYTNFAKFLPTATAAEKDTVIKLAVEKGITDGGFTALIKKYCDVDVISSINYKHQAEEK